MAQKAGQYSPKKAPVLQVPEQKPVDKWINLQKLTTERLFISALVGIGIFFVVFAGACFLKTFWPVPEDVIFYDARGFAEWQPRPQGQDGQYDDNIIEDQPFYGEIWESTARLFQVVPRVFFDNNYHAAGFIRWVSIVTVALVTLFSYRFRFLDAAKTSYLDRRYAYEERKAQQDDFSHLGGCLFLLTRFAFFGASIFGTYITLSVLLALSPLAFPGFHMGYWWMSLLVALICALINSIVCYWMLAIDSLELLLLGLFTWLGGLILSFVFAGPTYTHGKLWWCESISFTGRQLPSAPIFTASFLSFALVMIALWFDFDSFLQKFIIHAIDEATDNSQTPKPEDEALDNSQTPKPKKEVHLHPLVISWLRSFKPEDIVTLKTSTIIRWIRGLYVVMIIGFLCVGFIRTSDKYEINTWIHTGGIAVAGFIVLCFAISVPTNFFNKFYRVFVVVYILATIILTGLHLTPNDWTPCEGGLVTLTAYEIMMLSLVLIWVYLTLDSLIFYANQHWDKLKDIPLDNSNWLDRTWDAIKASFGGTKVSTQPPAAGSADNPENTPPQ